MRRYALSLHARAKLMYLVLANRRRREGRLQATMLKNAVAFATAQAAVTAPVPTNARQAAARQTEAEFRAVADVPHDTLNAMMRQKLQDAGRARVASLPALPAQVVDVVYEHMQARFGDDWVEPCDVPYLQPSGNMSCQKTDFLPFN
jgi:hypothetical protein